MLSQAGRDLYHVAGDPRLAEALVTPREAVPAAAVAREERAAIIAGEYDAEGRAPSRSELRDKHGISLESASVVLRMLAAEGWVTLEQGRGSILRPRRRFDFDAKVLRAHGAAPAVQPEPLALKYALQRSAYDAIRGEPAVVSVDVEARPSAVMIYMVVVAATFARAGLIAEGTLESMGKPWSWDGWDLAGASVTARPA